MTTPDWYQADDDDSDRARSNTALWRDRGAIIAAQQTRIAQLEAQIARVGFLAEKGILGHVNGYRNATSDALCEIREALS